MATGSQRGSKQGGSRSAGAGNRSAASHTRSATASKQATGARGSDKPSTATDVGQSTAGEPVDTTPAALDATKSQPAGVTPLTSAQLEEVRKRSYSPRPNRKAKPSAYLPHVMEAERTRLAYGVAIPDGWKETKVIAELRKAEQQAGLKDRGLQMRRYRKNGQVAFIVQDKPAK